VFDFFARRFWWNVCRPDARPNQSGGEFLARRARRGPLSVRRLYK
jgi:hypothetical protein